MNQFFTAEQVARIACIAFPDAQSIEVDPRDGYDITQDLAWQMRLRVRNAGRDLTCYLSTLDLIASAERLQAILVQTWREQVAA